MSEVQKLADEEAARAEAETPDAETPDEEEHEPVEGHPEPDTGGDPEPEPGAPPEATAPQDASEAEFEKTIERLEKEATRHANRVSEIMGENGQALQPCPLCWTPGFVYPPEVPWLDGDRIAAVKVAIGEVPTQGYMEAQDKQTCDECDGWGMTRTGARASAQEALPCRKCNGQGWIAKLHPVTTQSENGEPLAPTFAPMATGSEDAWHRPPGHPHWGMAPASVGV